MLDLPGVALRGLMGYEGHVMGISNLEEKEAKSAVFVTNPNATPRIARTSVFNSYRVGCLDCAETWGPKEAKVQFGSEF